MAKYYTLPKMISQEELFLQAQGGQYGQLFKVEGHASTLVARRIDNDWRYVLRLPESTLGAYNPLVWCYYKPNGNTVTGVTGDFIGDENVGCFDWKNGQNNISVTWHVSIVVEGQQPSQHDMSWNSAQAAQNKTDYAHYYAFVSYIGMPVFDNQTDADAYLAAVADYVVLPTLEHAAALKEALRRSLNPRYIDEDKYGEPSEPGGYGEDSDGGDGGTKGTWDNSSDKIGLPNKPSLGVSNMGFINVYKVNPGALAALGNDIFPTIQPGADIIDCLTAISDSLFNGRLIDYVVDCHIMPCNVPAGNQTSIVVGGRTCSAFGYPVSSDYVDVDCGSLNIGEYFANYLDYISTKSKLFLPFLGFVDMLPEFWQSGVLNVYYRFDVIDGSFMVFIRSKSSKSALDMSVIAQYGGSCAVHVPITGQNYSTLYSTLIGNGAAAVAAAAGGSIGAATTAAGGLMSSAFNLANQSAPVQQSNSYNATSSFLSVRKPFLLIERPKSQFSWGYPVEHGFPLNEYITLGSVSGFTVVDNPRFAFKCSDEELNEIISLLHEGVYF